VTTGTLNRGFAVLEWLAANSSGLSVREIATKLNIPASATHRILAELVQYGYVGQEQEYGKYFLTLKMCSLGLAQLSRRGIADIAQPILEQLARLSGEVARLGIVDGEQLVWVAKAQGATRGLRFDPDMGGIAPLSNTASGHAWLACLSDEEAVRLVTKQGTLARIGDDEGKNAPRTIGALLQYLHQARARGYSTLAEAVHVGIAAVAAAVIHPGSGQAIAVLAIAGPHVRLTDRKMAQLGPAVVEAARNLAATSAASPLLRKASPADVRAPHPAQPVRRRRVAKMPKGRSEGARARP
jgi:DNA-binding IclR family transcriptional regulator